MKNTAFIINYRFLVDIERSELFDKTTKEKNRLEPRLMKLLHLLIIHQGNIVKREFIIKVIWDDYPGANEGLNQAISFLRKLLADDHKAIIQTQPKVGYCLHADISSANKNQFSLRKPYLSLAIGAFILALLVFFILNIYIRKNALSATERQSNEKNHAEISRIDSIHQVIKRKRLLRDTLGPAAKGDSLRSD
jgi:DNA-binding winged helix-turn-helix (wHTH) protein